MGKNALHAIQDFGQSIWQDDIRRDWLMSGELQRSIAEDGLRGITSNPAIFEKAITGSDQYQDDIRALALQNLSAVEIYEKLTVQDVAAAADLFRPLYDGSEGRHGFVSLEVNPHLARDVEGTLAEARRLWRILDRPNVMIKVPATSQGLPCIKTLIGEGVNVNVTLLFGLKRYREVAEAYIEGLETALAAGRPLERIASVASFFLSRIDVWIDPMLDKVGTGERPEAAAARQLYGQVAIACAKRAYQAYQEIFDGERFGRLIAKKARTQRLLWASTGTKDPSFSDIKYVEALIGSDTVNTLPVKTIAAYRDHGDPAERLTADLDKASEILKSLAGLGINIDQVAQDLLDQGIDKFNKPYDSLLGVLDKARSSALAEPLDRQIISAGAGDAPIRMRTDQLQQDHFTERLWRKDPSLWTADPDQASAISESLGWLEVPRTMQDRLKELAAFSREVMADQLEYVVHMGMGGSSLAPMVFARCFPAAEDGALLSVLDTTDPVALHNLSERLDPRRTLFIVASKSGTTAEPLAFCDFFYSRLQAIKGDEAGAHFVAITDPGSPLADLARERRFRRVFLNFSDIGGRYSALSYFGLLPAVLMGLDVTEMLIRAQRMMLACGPESHSNESEAEDREPPEKDYDLSPGLSLGAALGELARLGRDKITFIVPPSLAPFGMWLEQLLAESTGKNGTGLLPVAGEALLPPELYGDDRVFVHIRLDREPEPAQTCSLNALAAAGHPMITIRMRDRLDVAQEFFRWEVATAAAGAVLGINPFDQPNVKESKDNTGRLLKILADTGQLPQEKAELGEGPLTLFLPSGQAAPTLDRSLAAFLGQVRPDDYIALLAYLCEEAAVEALLGHTRHMLQHRLHTAVTVGYGPRYLHSTGQYHKGGPNNGLFIILTCDADSDPAVPDKGYTFGQLRAAQARGDMEALHGHGRRVVRIHLGPDAAAGLVRFTSVLDQALAAMAQRQAI